MRKRDLSISFMLGLSVFILAIGLIAFPETVFQSSLKGLKIWWDIVFPALLPFFIISEFMMGYGVAHFLGVLLEPIMRPVFNLPGIGAFGMVMGLSSGYPMGAKITVQLKEQNLITRSEGERLVSFISTSDPLFMFGAVAVGFFHDVSFGFMIVLVHYVSAILVGLLMRFHDRKGERSPYIPSQEPILLRALKTMHNARIRDGRPFGKLMGDAVSSSINTLLVVGGLIMIFSVFVNIMEELHFTEIFTTLISGFLYIIGLPSALAPSIISGIFEVTNGAKVASEATAFIPMIDKLAVVGMILAWGGLSVHAQIASILSTTDIRYKPYLIARFLQTVLAFLLTYIVYEPIQYYLPSIALPAFLMTVPQTNLEIMWELVSFSLIVMSCSMGLLLAGSMLFVIGRKTASLFDIIKRKT